ncbi:hypothetical protein EDB19DRAFT_1102084 [Suillus lakei]|nr:hypothetical protein EDB19DRAFT_1154953 [Suillus lakei]KAG1735404.1 hypothetical protein EDB19DRAFT_1102084 [Suillus lakei]
MDDLAIQYLLLNEDEAELFDDEGAQVLAAALIAGIEVTRQHHIDTRNPRRLYLCRPQLLPNPRINIPWQVLYDSQSDTDGGEIFERDWSKVYATTDWAQLVVGSQGRHYFSSKRSKTHRCITARGEGLRHARRARYIMSANIAGVVT